MHDLIVVEQINPVEIFNGKNLDPLLDRITKQVKEFKPDTSTAKGRKEIASLAHKVAKSKTFLDNAGKKLVADWKNRAKVVDAERKRMRDYLDNLKDETRHPLTEWEEAEKARLEKEAFEKEYAEAWDAALVEDELFNRQREIERKEAELKRQEEERLAREQAEREAKEAEERRIREEQERKEREARIAKEAAEQAQREAEEKARQERERWEEEKRAAKEAAEKAERDRIAAIERAKIEKEMAIKAEQEKARQEAERKEQARLAEEKRVKEEQERKERKRLAKEAEEKAERERKAADLEHRKRINNMALKCFEDNGIDTETAKEVVGLIARGLIDFIKIEY